MEIKLYDEDQLNFIHPFKAVISGPSGSGKSHIAFNIIRYRRQMIKSERDLEVLFCLPENHQITFPDDIKRDRNVKLVSGFPNFQEIFNPSLIIIDDFMSQLNNDIVELFTRFSSHRGLSVALLVQNFFYGGSKNVMRTISLNATHLFICKSSRDKRQVMSIASQISPHNTNFILQAYKDACKEPYSYLLIDVSPQQEEIMRVRAKIFPNEKKPNNVIYVEKDGKNG